MIFKHARYSHYFLDVNMQKLKFLLECLSYYKNYVFHNFLFHTIVRKFYDKTIFFSNGNPPFNFGLLLKSFSVNLDVLKSKFERAIF